MKPQTTAQILRCFSLGGYTASVVEGELKVRGPQPLAGPLPASIKANREEIIGFLSGCCGGVWPPARGSEFAELEHKKFVKRFVHDRLRALRRIRLELLRQILRDAGGTPSLALPAAKSLGCTVERLPEYENREFVFAPREWREGAVVKAERGAA